MAKRLFGKKKKKAAEPVAETKGPIITQLENLPPDSALRKMGAKLRPGQLPSNMATILGYDPRISGKLGQ